jgi:hypothetical protein
VVFDPIEFKCENANFSCIKRNIVARVICKWPLDCSDGHVEIQTEIASVGGDSAPATHFGSGHALDFGKRSSARFGHALVIDCHTTMGVARGADQRAGLARLGIDARLNRSAAFGAGHIEIAIGNAHGDHIIACRSGNGGGSESRKGDQGKGKTHDNSPEQ